MNHGRWIADCPFACGNSEKITKVDTLFVCSNCEVTAKAMWPKNADAIWGVLSKRPITNRNWYYADHPLAVLLQLPHGQTVSDLEQENLDHMVVGVDTGEYLERFI